jgi:hypothetical protein
MAAGKGHVSGPGITFLFSPLDKENFGSLIALHEYDCNGRLASGSLNIKHFRTMRSQTLTYVFKIKHVVEQPLLKWGE